MERSQASIRYSIPSVAGWDQAGRRGGEALAIAQELEDDGEISAKEVRDNRATLEDARDAIDGLLRSLSPSIRGSAA